MADERPALRDRHRLFGSLLTDYFTGSPFVVEVERELSVERQFLHVVIPDPGPHRTSIVRRTVQYFLDMVIVRRGPGRVAGRLPDGLKGSVAHNFFTECGREAPPLRAGEERPLGSVDCSCLIDSSNL
jgi:hypothetical protein